jgi:sporulation protein YlmC with PRC-barrel domain
MKHRRLQELGRSDFEIVDGQPDIRGWDVKTADGKEIGEVDELILDAQARKVRYMIVDLDDDALDLDGDRKVLIPIGLAELHEKDDDVLIPNVSLDQLRQLPAYDADNFDAAYEQSVCTVFGRTALTDDTATTDDASWYQHEHFNDQKLYQRRLPPSTSAGNQDSGLQFRDRMDSNSEDTGRVTDTREHRNRSESFRKVEEDSLQAVNNNRLSDEFDRTDDNRQQDQLQSPVERDIEQRNREDNLGRRNMDL